MTDETSAGSSKERLYAVGERECWKLGDHYTRHSLAMTAEGLHRKSDIAAELAVRDAEIERLQSMVDSQARMIAWLDPPDSPTDETRASHREALERLFERAACDREFRREDVIAMCEQALGINSPTLKATACQCDPNPSIGGSPPCPVHDGESESEV